MNKKLSRRDFLKVAGVTSAGLALSACGVKATEMPTLTATVLPSPTATNTLMPTATTTPIPSTLRALAEKIQIKGEPFKIGTHVDYGDPDWQSDIYNQTVRDEFNLIAPGAAFTFQYMDQYPTAAPHWLNVAENNNAAFEIKPLFWQGDEPFTLDKLSVTSDAVESFMVERVRKILPFVSKKVPTQIVLANEPFWEFQGKRGWQGEYGGSPFYEVYGKKWIAKAYTELYQIAKEEFNLIAGKDFQIIGIIERGIDLPNPRTDFVINQVNTIKQDISSNLGIPLEQISFGLGSEFHFGDTYKDRDITIPYSTVDKDGFKNTFLEINQQTGCPIFVTETSDLGGTEEDVANAYSNLIGAAVESGIVQEVEFWGTFKFLPSDYWRSTLFLPGFKKGQVYQSVFNLLSQYPRGS